MLSLLPVLVAALQMQAPPSQREIEQALADGVREKLAAGWTLVDVRGDEDEVTVTLAHGAQVERHVAHIDSEGGNAVRVEIGGALPAHARPDEFFAQAVASGGGIEIGGDCGTATARAYFVEAHAKGKRAASRLVAKTLQDSEDIESAYLDGDHAELAIELAGGKAGELIIMLDDHAKVIEAEVRRYELSSDTSTHVKQDAMKRRIGDAVTAIVDGTTGPILVGAKRFEISAIERNDPEDLTCGC